MNPILDELLEAQREINKAQSDLCTIMSVPAGARLLKWARAVQNTWWYKLCSKFDRRVK